jgi:integrase
MLEELQRRNYTTDTIRGYILAVEQFAQYFHKSPELMGPEEIGRFQLHLLQDKKLAVGTIALRMGALRFLYKKTLKRRDLDFDDLPLLKKPKKLPVVLSPEEVTRLIEAAPNLLYRTLLIVLYATGLRRSEVAHLKVSDIDRSLMLIHVQQGKGSRDRKLPLTEKVYEALCEYWRAAKIKPRAYLFPTRIEPRSKRSRSPIKRCGLRVMKRHSAPVSPDASGHIPCGTASRRTCSKRVPTCARSSCCWVISL